MPLTFTTNRNSPISFTNFDGSGFGLPSYIIDFDGVADNATDNSPSFAAAIDELKSLGGGTLLIGPGIFRFASPLTLTNADAITIRGVGRVFSSNSHGTVLRYTGNGDFITFSGGNGCGVSDLRIDSTTVKTSGYDIVLSSCARATVSNVNCISGYNGIHITGCNGVFIDHVDIGYIYGQYGIFHGNSAILFIDDYIGATAPTYNITSVKTWTINTAFVQGDCVLTNGNAYQCSQSGTSAAAGTGPSGITGSDPFSNPITDNTARWVFLWNQDLAWIQHGNGSQTITIQASELLWGSYGLRVTDSNSNFVFLFDTECEQSLRYAVSLEAGTQFQATCCWFNNSHGTGMRIAAAYLGTVSIGQSQIAGHPVNGLDILNGTQNIYVTDCIIRDCTSRNINCQASGVSITNNQCTGSVDGVYLDTTATNVTVTGNDVSGNSSNGINDNSANTTIVLRDNRGWNPVGASTISTSASPFSYRAGHSPETVYFSASTSITALTVNGVSILPAATGANVNFTVELGPNELSVTTYTGTLTAKKMIH